MLLGAFQAQDEGFASPVLVGEPDKVEPMLERLGLKSKPYKLVAIGPEESPAQRRARRTGRRLRRAALALDFCASAAIVVLTVSAVIGFLHL